MNFFSRLLKRLKFRRTIKTDQSKNVIDGMVKAKKLYKELCIKAHPDKNPDKQDVAEELMQKVVACKYNYEGLLNLSIEIKNKLGV